MHFDSNITYRGHKQTRKLKMIVFWYISLSVEAANTVRRLSVSTWLHGAVILKEDGLHTRRSETLTSHQVTDLL
jgi:hypothetical protein